MRQLFSDSSRRLRPFYCGALLASLSTFACATGTEEVEDPQATKSDSKSDNDAGADDADKKTDNDDKAPLVLGKANKVEGEFPAGLVEGRSPTPPMGWNSWNHFGCNTSADQIMSMADAMVDSGMKDAGYEYINIDDCWQQLPEDGAQSKHLDGPPEPAIVRFPDGMKAVADYVHDLGLKLGIYSDRGDETCARRFGSRGYLDVDVQTYSDWGIDYLKYDNCDYIYPDKWDHNLDDELIQEEFTAMSKAMRSGEREMVFSICAWKFYEWAVPLGELWRTTGDITDSWDSITANIITNSAGLAAYAGPNHWNDPDMLEVGRGGMSRIEYEAHFSMWSIMAAPLISGNDLRAMSDETLDILTNTEVIAVNQDALGFQGVKVQAEGNTATERSVWVKPLDEYGARAVAFLNKGEETTTISIPVSELFLQDSEVTIRDLWEHENLDPVEGVISVKVARHGVVMLKVVGDEPPIPHGEVDVSDLDWTYAANKLGPAEKDMSNGASAPEDGDVISIGDKEYDKGLGVAAASLLSFRLGANCDRFTADVGVDGQTGDGGSVEFEVWGDNEILYDGDLMRGTEKAESVDVNVEGVYRLKLKVTNGMNGAGRDYASWGNPRLHCKK